MIELVKDKLNSYPERGYCFPIDVFSSSEVAEFRRHFDDFYAYHSEELRVLPANKHGSIYGHTHTFLRWVYRIVSHPKVLDAVEGILGPNLTSQGYRLVRQNAGRQEIHFLASGWDILGTSPAEGHDRMDRALGKHFRKRVHACHTRFTQTPSTTSRDVCRGQCPFSRPGDRS